MARDIFSISGMSAEVERLFSSVKHMLSPTKSFLRPEGIEAAECVRSWVKAGNNYFEYLPVGDSNVKLQSLIVITFYLQVGGAFFICSRPDLSLGELKISTTLRDPRRSACTTHTLKIYLHAFLI
jgi:hypothetical protein